VSVWLKLSSDTAPDWDRGFSRGVCVEADADNYRLVFWFDN
jgi:hypothetical protein